MNAYFFVAPYKNCKPKQTHYQQEVIVLAEGLRHLGWRCIGNVDYWPFFNNEYLIQKASLDQFPLDVIVCSGAHFLVENKGRFDDFYTSICNKGVPVVFTDFHDGFLTPTIAHDCSIFDLILKGHFSNKFKVQGNAVPWTFGIPDRVADATMRRSPFAERRNNVLWNFRISHGLRMLADKKFRDKIEQVIPTDTKSEEKDGYAKGIPGDYLQQLNCHTGGRHNPGYFEKLITTKACSAFGGSFTAWCYGRSFIETNLRRVNKRLPLFPKDRLYQWDSFRLWESFAAACLTIHIDFLEEGCLFPVRPQNHVHYLGFSLTNQVCNEKNLAIMAGNATQMAEIAESGNQFAMKHYRSTPTAERFLSLLAKI